MAAPEALLQFKSSMLALTLLFLTSGILYYILFIQGTRARKFLRRFKGPPMIPLLGNGLALANPENVFKIVSEFPEKYGNRVAIVAGAHNFLVIYHPDDIKAVLNSNEILGKGWSHEFVRPYGGNGLVLSDGNIWHARRKLLNPAFNFKMLNSFHEMFVEQSQVLREIIGEKVGHVEESQIPMLSMFQRLTLSVLSESALGVELNCQRDCHEKVFAAIRKASKNLATRATRPWLHPELIFALSSLGRDDKQNIKFIHGFIDDIIQNHKQKLVKQTTIALENAMDKAGTKKMILLDLLINAQMSGELELSDEDIRDEIMVFMVAGQDTTATAMFWTVMLLAAHSKAQAQVHEEIDSVFENDRSRPITVDDISKLPYLTACIKEALRLYPSGATISRRVEKDFKLDADTVVPSGVEIVMSLHVTHRLPEFFPDPLEFKPSRHFPDNVIGRHASSYVPFSAGPRNCIGQKYALAQIKVVLADIFRNFTVSPVDPIESLIPIQEVATRPNIDGRCRFELRK